MKPITFRDLARPGCLLLIIACASGMSFGQTTSARTTPAHSTATHPAAPVIQPENFESPEAAVNALIDAASKGDNQTLTTILGSRSRKVLTSGNEAQDEKERAEFAKLASTKNHIEHSSMNRNTAILLVGNEDWPFPIPLVRTGQEWHFDPERGDVEMQARRIGADELDVIEICVGYVAAQEAYAAQKASGAGAYAQRIMSSTGGKDGLYQPGKSPELVPAGFAAADGSLPGKKPYHGYYFRVLTGQGSSAPGGAHRYLAGNVMLGGFGLVAWPAEYGVTGIHTFVVNQDGQVFEKDLGARTAAAEASITRYDPDDSWTPVD